MRNQKLSLDKTPTISVIIPTYNRSYCLGKAINSVINQTITNWELIIIDNYSTDNTKELICNFNDSRIKSYQYRNHGIVAASRNKGVDISSGEYIAFLDSDDWWDKRKLEKSLAAIKEGADFIYHELYIMSDDANTSFFWNKTQSRNLKSPIFNDLLLNGNAISNSSVVVRRSCLEKIRGFSEDPSLVGAEDYDAWLKISKDTERFIRLPICLGYYSLGANNLSSGDRSIMNLNRILELYSNDLIKLGIGTPVWIKYTIGVSNKKMGKISEARKQFMTIVLNRGSFKFRLRALVFMLILF
jgi:glycosyltransferase involved in cell wall biosynthesis